MPARKRGPCSIHSFLLLLYIICCSCCCCCGGLHCFDIWRQLAAWFIAVLCGKGEEGRRGCVAVLYCALRTPSGIPWHVSLTQRDCLVLIEAYFYENLLYFLSIRQFNSSTGTVDNGHVCVCKCECVCVWLIALCSWGGGWGSCCAAAAIWPAVSCAFMQIYCPF